MFELAGEDWVSDEVAPSGVECGTIRNAVLQQYYADHISRWDELLSGLRIVPLSSLDSAARVLNVLAGPDSPLKKVMRAALRETTLEYADSGAAVTKGLDELVIAKLQAAQNRLKAALGSAAAEAPARRARNLVDAQFESLRTFAGPPNAGGAGQRCAGPTQARSGWQAGNAGRHARDG